MKNMVHVLILTIAFAVPALAQTLDEEFAALSGYQPGGDSTSLERIADAVTAAHKNPASKSDLEARLVAGMRSKESTADARWFAAKQLYRIASPATSDGIAPLLVQSTTSDMARYVIERIPGSAATSALVNALRVTRGGTRIGILNSLGERRDPAAFQNIKALTGNGDPRVMEAAMIALGKIGGQQSADQLLWCSRNVRPDLRPIATEAYLMCADLFLARGDAATAAEMYERVYTGPERDRLRMAALQGYVSADPAGAGQIVLEVLRSGDTPLYSVAASAIRELNVSAEPILEALPSLRPSHQALVLNALAERGDPAALPALLQAANSPHPDVRYAAISGLGSYSDTQAVTVLLRTASSAEGEEQEASRRSLRRMNSPDINDRLVSAAMSADNAVRAEAIRALGDRNAPGAVPVLLRAAERDVESIRIAAIEALGDCAGADEMKDLVELLLESDTAAMRSAAQEALLDTARRLPVKPDRTQAIRRGYKGGAETDLAIIAILGSLQDDNGLETLETAARKGKGDVKIAALRALGQWPTPRPLDAVSSIAGKSKVDDDRRLAVEAMIRLLRLPSDRPMDETLGYYAEAGSLATTAAERKQILAGLGELKDARALPFIAPYLTDEEVAAEAELAQSRIMDGAAN